MNRSEIRFRQMPQRLRRLERWFCSLRKQQPFLSINMGNIRDCLGSEPANSPIVERNPAFTPFARDGFASPPEPVSHSCGAGQENLLFSKKTFRIHAPRQ